MKILQFGEGNFLRAFVDYMIDAANEAGVLDAQVVIAKAIRAGSLDALRAQGCSYTLLTRGRQNGQTIESTRTIRSVSDAICCYEDFDALMDLARDPELALVVSNTTEAGIAVSDEDRADDRPPVSYPAKLTRLLFERYTHFAGDRSKGLYLLPCELIKDNARELERCVALTAQRWSLPADFTARYMNVTL